jgi:hypothetical protein
MLAINAIASFLTTPENQPAFPGWKGLIGWNMKLRLIYMRGGKYKKFKQLVKQHR